MPDAITARLRADSAPGADTAEHRRGYWYVVLVVYVVLYATLLFKTDGYPYVLDNNESYSSLWHARSLYENGVAKTKGLTDEVFSPAPAASPYVHTHQGNFPRLFSFVLYAAGFHGIASQIWITTFTVGLAGIYLAFRFLSRLGNPLYAALACLVMMTNYLLFAQWQVSLYNVWHVFFFFSSLLCVQALGQPEHRGRWALLTVLNFAAFCYWEYVFTAFVAGLCGLYTIALHWRRPRDVLRAWLLMGTGAALAAGLLLAQLSAYMGWSNVMEDVRLTLTARNTNADSDLLGQVGSFYREHRIIFWHNFMDASPLRTLPVFWHSLVSHHLRYYSPALGLAMLVAALGLLLGGSFCSRGLRPSHSPGWKTVLKWLGLTIPISWMLPCFLPATATPSLTNPAWWLGGAGLTVLLGRLWLGGWWQWSRLSWWRILAGGLFSFFAGSMIRPQAGIFDEAFQQDLADASGWSTWRPIGGLLAVGFALLALSCSVLGNAQMLGRVRSIRLSRLPVFMLCGLLAYAAAYRVFTGYIFSGYLDRQVPLLVFLSDMLLALALYLAIAPLGRVARARKWHLRSPTQNFSSAGLVALGAGVAILTVSQWATLQAVYLGIAPPDAYAFLSVLDQPRFKGLSLVASTYPAPMAARTGSWGYADTSVFSGNITLTPRGFESERNLDYLWMADAATNPVYLKPDLAVYVVQTPSIAVALQLKQERDHAEPDVRPLTESTGLVQGAQPLQRAFLVNRLVYDDRRRASIVQLDWDYPPFLRPDLKQFLPAVSTATLGQKLALNSTAYDQRRRWRVSLQTTEASLQGRLLAATIDERPVFAVPASATASLETQVMGDHLHLEFARGPAAGKVRVQVNDMDAEVDLADQVSQPLGFDFYSAYPHGNRTFVPIYTPGQALQTSLVSGNGQVLAEVKYHYTHQENTPEANSVLRVYREAGAGNWLLADTIAFLGEAGIPVRMEEFRRANPDTVAEHLRVAAIGDKRTYAQWLTDHLTAHPEELTRTGIVREGLPALPRPSAATDPIVIRRVPLPAGAGGRLQLSLTPGTRSKLGPEYFGLPFSLPDPRLLSLSPLPVAFQLPEISPGAPFPFGRLKLRLRFPTNRTGQAEPILTTGVREAGDFVYVIYEDERHIRLGFDHWFKGGAATKPIEIDYAAEHTMEISVGSLFPPEEAVVFDGLKPETVSDLKHRVQISLDGQPVLDLTANGYEASESTVTIGRNDIKGTSSGPLFTGEVLSAERVWPSTP